MLTLLTDRIDAELLAAAPSLKVVSNMAVGYDNIDVAACRERGVRIGHTPGVLTETSADFAFSLLLALARRVVEGDAFVRAGKWKTWDPGLLLGPDVHGKTLGIIGMGKIGQAVARRATGFSMRVLYASPSAVVGLGEHVDLERLFREADFVTLHVPLNDRTRRMVSARELGWMKPGALLVNTARGGVVDQDALLEALRSGHLGGAALDVMDPEPLPAEHPLLTAPNLLVAPHIASASIETRSKMAELAAENLLAALEGRPMPHEVTR